jgi:hypothetical protein
MSFLDILDPEAIKLVQEWLFVEHSNMVAASSFGPNVRRAHDAIASLGFGQAVQPHEALVIGQDHSAFVPVVPSGIAVVSPLGYQQCLLTSAQLQPLTSITTSFAAPSLICCNSTCEDHPRLFSARFSARL